MERELWETGIRLLAGVDEAGRGPLAGPVVAAAVIIERSFLEAEEHGILNGLTDSKKLSAARREHFFKILTSAPAVKIGVGRIDSPEIDKINILRATHAAMAQAVLNLPLAPDHILVDGLPVPGLHFPSTAIIGGDGSSLLIAAASIIAKVTRDRLMKEFHVLYPVYGFDRHKGYGSSAHMQALFEHGPCPIHRVSFSPVRNALQLKRDVNTDGVAKPESGE
jgi:ribonuclease HII